MRVAIIGTREPSAYQQVICGVVAEELARKGHHITSGGAIGIDQKALFSAHNVNRNSISIYLPWDSYNAKDLTPIKHNNFVIYNPITHKDWAESVYKYHPAARNLTQGAFKLHARNYGIIHGTDVVIALPSGGNGGGTAQGIRIAEDLHIPLFVFPTDVVDYNPEILRLQQFLDEKE